MQPVEKPHIDNQRPNVNQPERRRKIEKKYEETQCIRKRERGGKKTYK